MVPENIHSYTTGGTLGGGGGGGGVIDWNPEDMGGFSGLDFEKGNTSLQTEPKL